MDPYAVSSSHTVNEAAGSVSIKRTFGSETTNANTFLLDKDCSNEVTKVLTKTDTSYNNNEVTSTIQVNVNEIGAALDDNIIFASNGDSFTDDDDFSVGKIDFCLKSTSITLWNGEDVEMSSFKGRYSISYQVDNDFLVIAGVTASEIDPTDELDFNINLQIVAQRCSDGSESFSGPDVNSVLAEGDTYYLCINVEGGTLNNIDLDASYSETAPGVYSETISLVDGNTATLPIIALSDVGTSTKQISIPIVSAFLEGLDGASTNLKLSGSADITFSGNRGQKLLQTETYQVVVKIGKAADFGCFGPLFRMTKKLFV